MDPLALGRYLRESREAKELNLEDAVRALRIRRNVLDSFEAGDFNVADSPVRVRGMLRNYARYLGLEEDRVLQYYEAAHSSRRKRRFLGREPHIEPLAPKKITDTPPALPAVKIPEASNNNFGGIVRNLAMLLVSFAALAVIVFVTINLLEFGEDVALEPTATQGTVTITPTFTPSLTPATPLPTATEDRVALGLVNLQVVLEMQQRSWLRIRIDGQDVFTGILEPNTVQTYEGVNSIEILAANAAALRINYNGQEQGSFGGRGEQVELRFSSAGVESSLATIEAPTEQPILTPEATEEAALAQSSVANVDMIVTPTSLLIAPSTPTPLFPSTNNTTSDSSASVAASPTSLTLNTANASPTSNTSSNNPVPTASSPAPTASPTSAAVLPIRATPVDGTATKES